MSGQPAEVLARREITLAAVRRFAHLGNQTIARHLALNYPEYYENLEAARSAVRYAVGAHGRGNRNRASVKKEKVELPRTWARPREDFVLPNGVWGYMSDVHIPMHEPKPIEAAIKLFKQRKITGLLLNGDILDYAGVGFWPGLKRDFDKEIELSIDFLDFLKGEFPKLPIVFKPGNHEYRLPRYFVRHAPELATTPIAAMEHVLGFEKRKIKFLDWKQKIRAAGLQILHGDEVRIQSAVNPARGLFLAAKASALCGHVHRTSEHVERNLLGEMLSTWSVACMCDLSPDYAPYTGWNWGCAIIHVYDYKQKLGGFEVENRRILPNGRLA